MANANVSVLDATGTSRLVDAQTTTDGDLQQTVTIGDGTNNGRVLLILSDGAAMVGTNVSSTATKTAVTPATTDTLLLAANTSRRGFMIFNRSAAILYLSFGTTAASLTSFSAQVPATTGLYVGDVPLFTGQIRGIWGATPGTNTAQITEFTA